MGRYDKKNGTLHLYMKRPGVFIGVKGTVLKGIVDYITKKDDSFINIKIHEYESPVKKALYSELLYLYINS